MLLIAKSSFPYPSSGVRKRNLKIGDLFEAKDQYARSLIAAGLAEESPPWVEPPVTKRSYKRRDLTAETEDA